MKRIMIIGCGGAGKSTLSRQLHASLGLPLHHLDQYFWQAGWVEIDRQEWKRLNEKLVAEDRWIIDGNYGSTMDMRLARADTVIFLDYPTWIRLYRVLKRAYRYRGRTRPDMTEGCPEKLEWGFIWYVLRYRATRTPGILRKIAALREDQQAFVLRTDREVRAFLRDKLGLP
jgi:adenylate kinase family enzyme